MKVNRRGIELIKRWEGLELTAYRCPAGVLTIGYGHTGPDVTPGKRITEVDAEALLLRDLERFERGVEDLTKGLSLTGNQFSALVSFAYNCGLDALARSTLLRKLRAGDLAGAAAEFARWNKGGGKVLPGLVKRRAAERELFLDPRSEP